MNNKNIQVPILKKQQHFQLSFLDFHLNEKSRKISTLIQSIRSSDKDQKKAQINDLFKVRKKQKILTRKQNFRDIYQNPLIPANTNPRIFSSQKPISTGAPFLDQKQKNKVIYSERAFLHKPNIVSGVYNKHSLLQSQPQKKQFLNRKFSDYDAIVSEQSGPIKRILKKRLLTQNNIQTKSSICVDQKNRIFSEFQGSKYDFYDKPMNPENLQHLLQNSQRISSMGNSTHKKSQPNLSTGQLRTVKKRYRKLPNIVMKNISHSLSQSTNEVETLRSRLQTSAN